MPLCRFLPLVLACLCALPAARAHDIGDSGLVISFDEENLVVVCSLSLPAATALLPAGAAGPLSSATFETQRPALETAAGRGIALAGASGAALAPERILVSLHDRHEVRFEYFFPRDARPAQLSLPLLGSLPPGVRCPVTDLRLKPPARALLFPRSSVLALPAVP